jgi:hypothetical protein
VQVALGLTAALLRRFLLHLLRRSLDPKRGQGLP